MTLPESARRLPAVILACFAVDLGLGGLYLLNHALGEPVHQLTKLVDLGGEANLPTWFATVQWFSVAIAMGAFAFRQIRRDDYRSWLLLGLPAVFALLSLDEAIQIHEWLGSKADRLLPGGSREGTRWFRTGIWMFILGVPFAAVFGGLVWSVRGYFSHAHGALLKIGAGVGLMLVGAVGVEVLLNFVTSRSLYIAQTLLEELLELGGSTVVLWGAVELLIPADRTRRDASEPAGAPGTRDPTVRRSRQDR